MPFLTNPAALPWPHEYESMGYKRAGEAFFRKGEFCLFEKQLGSG